MHRFRFTLLVSIVVGFACASGSAEDLGGVSGALIAPDGVALCHVPLRLSGVGVQQTIVTGPDGTFQVDRLSPGIYVVRSETPGFIVGSDGRFTVTPGSTTYLRVTLAPAPVRERVLVTATRGHAPLSHLGSSATVIDAERIEARRPMTFGGIVEGVPGLSVARLGGPGQQSSVFVRGGESRFARVLVDGVPVNEPGGSINLGPWLPLDIDRVEVVRGAASSLYGTDALAGVIHVLTRRVAPDESLNLRFEAEGGSFDTSRIQTSGSGRIDRLDWNAGALRMETDNEAPNSRFSGTALIASTGAEIGAGTRLRAVVRGDWSEAGTPGQVLFERPDLDALYEHSAFSGSVALRHESGRVAHDLRLGIAATDHLSLNPEDSGPYTASYGDLTGYSGADYTNPEGYQNDVRRLSASHQIEAQIESRHLVTLGMDLEHETGALGNRREELLRPERTNVGVFLQDRIVIGSRLFATAGGRAERNASFGWVLVPRVTLAFRPRSGENAMTLRASAGAGIKEPGFLESFGQSLFAEGNSDLQPERSRTYDAGVEQRFLQDRLRVEATAFHHDYQDQIAYTVVSVDPYRGTYVNLARTRARGVELALEAAPFAGLHVKGEYTCLDGEIRVSPSDFDPVYAVGRPLLRRPRHQGAFSCRFSNERLSIGATMHLVGRRADSDFVGLGLMENDGYARFDARFRLRLVRGVDLLAAGDNLLDRSYQEALGYPALGRSLRVGLRLERENGNR